MVRIETSRLPAYMKVLVGSNNFYTTGMNRSTPLRDLVPFIAALLVKNNAECLLSGFISGIW